MAEDHHRASASSTMADHEATTTQNTSAPSSEIYDNEKEVPSSAHSSEAAGAEVIKVESRVPGNPNYYEKNGLRTYGDGEDHDHETPVSNSRIVSVFSMVWIFVGSQIPVYLFGGIAPIIYGDIGGVDRWEWITLGYLLALAAMCPFVGAISDLVGRRYVALFGTLLITVGQIVCAKAKNMNIFIAGMVLTGAGAGINELTAIASNAEIVSTRKRGRTIAFLVFSILPFIPSVLYSQLIASHSSWRYVALVCAVWNFIGLLLVAFFYFPPPRINSTGLTRRQIIGQIDFGGGFLSIVGMILFVAGLVWGGSQYHWKTPHVLVPLILGFLFLVAFGFWEVYGTDHPMFPTRLRKEPRILALTLVVTCISGANFFALLLFWPTQAFNVYGHDPIGVGIRGLPVGFSVLVGAFISLWLLSLWKGRIRLIMVVSSVLMTVGVGAMAAARQDNINAVYGILVVGGLGVGGIVVPATVIITIICPDDLIGTVSALSLAIRVVGGSVGYAAYYNVFRNKLVTNLGKYITLACIEHGIVTPAIIREIAVLTGASLTEDILLVPGVAGNVTIWKDLVTAGQHAYAESYPWVYYVSIAFGGVAVIASCMLGDISPYMDDHVAVVMH